ncbi:MAG: hypothetical protein H7235_08835 [Bdellovibrionaceae bacterium]|nr:hypothetical protein [Pseudobdellovibrionaceae bacterium]
MHKYIFLLVGLSLGSTNAACDPICQTLTSAKQKLESWVDDLQCHELPVGYKRVVYYPTDELSPTGVSAKYLLTRKNKDLYEIELPLKLNKKAGDQSVTTIEQRIKLCLSISDSLLKGPDGTKIKIKPIFEPSSTFRHLMLGREIDIKGEDFRSHSLAYNENIDCPTIIHEVLHDLGLADEYQESTVKNKKTGDLKYPCRVLGPENSVMNDQREAMRFVSGTKTSVVTALVCEKVAKRCWEFNEVLDGKIPEFTNYTPKEFEELFKYLALQKRKRQIKEMEKFPYSEKALKDPLPWESDPQMQISKMVFKEIPANILEPAHVRAILFPGCKKKNAVYYKCAKLAYADPEPGQQCYIPPECQSENWLN